MKRNGSALVLLVLAIAPVAMARVISYSPFTNRIATRGIHLRTTRHFVLIEEIGTSGSAKQVVLYDSTGAKPPRLIYPIGGGAAAVRQVALYEDSPSAPPLILLTASSNAVTKTLFSRDEGESWTEIAELRDAVHFASTTFDFGGPFTRGLRAPIVIGNEVWPFVAEYYSKGVYAIGRDGTAKSLNATSLLGRDAEGKQFLVGRGQELLIVTPDGKSLKAANVDARSSQGGWITHEKGAYVVTGGFLRLHRFGATETIIPGGPRLLAVPTHDFNGAWIVRRGTQTVLQHHTRATGLETRWIDPTAPAIEALHTGKSGVTLLIQVHRERESGRDDPFLDPALAIWRLGDPPPREYDELFLNEAAQKGFVHLDVDAVADGEPFVFDSAWEREAPGIIVSPPIAGGIDVTQEWGVVRASLKQRLVLPGVARMPGAFGSFWLTDVVISNPLEDAQMVVVRLAHVGSAVEAAAQSTSTIRLEPRETRVISDVVKTLFGLEHGGGSLYFEPDAGVSVTGRTYTRKGAGTYGYGMHAIDYFSSAAAGTLTTFAGAFPGAHFRTNVLLTDGSESGAEVLLSQNGNTIATVAAGPGGVAQFNGADGLGDSQSTGQSALILRPSRGFALSGVVAIDNRTNDPTYFSPDLTAVTERFIPVIGHVDGANGSQFRTDLYLLNPTESFQDVLLEAYPLNGSGLKEEYVSLEAGESRVIEDAAQTLFGLHGLARLRYVTLSPEGGVRVTSRTYTREVSGATYGSIIPPLNSFQIIGEGESLVIHGIVGDAGFRTNLGLVDLSSHGGFKTNVHVSVFDDRQRQLTEFTVDVAAMSGTQINDLFRTMLITPPKAATIVVEVEGRGRITAYATLTDNVTNDTTYLAPQLGATP